MTLVDAGPLTALIDADEPEHARCAEALEVLALPLVTSWPAFTEAMYLVGRAGGIDGQEALWRMVEGEILRPADLGEATITRSRELLKRYRDHPMDLADATLVALAEAENHRTVFTLDSHFRSYRLRGGRHLLVVPD